VYDQATAKSVKLPPGVISCWSAATRSPNWIFYHTRAHRMHKTCDVIALVCLCAWEEGWDLSIFGVCSTDYHLDDDLTGFWRRNVQIDNGNFSLSVHDRYRCQWSLRVVLELRIVLTFSHDADSSSVIVCYNDDLTDRWQYSYSMRVTRYIVKQ
jgi:hypothetical protein